MTENIKDGQKRKAEHIKIALSDSSQKGNPGFSGYSFIHNALPELNFNKIDTTTHFLGKKVNYPFFISCITGGFEEGKRINDNLARAAQEYKIAMGVGSQRVAIENSQLEIMFKVRKLAPDIPLLANIGLVQLNYGFGLKEFQKAVDMIEADALVIHLNPIQEVIQPGGNVNWEGLLLKLGRIIPRLTVPVIVKEVGFGLSKNVVERLYKAGVKIVDTAGWGGTNWSVIEGKRRDDKSGLGMLFSQWGIPTTESIKMCRQAEDSVNGKITVIGSGGVRSGIDVAKAIALGSDLVGIAQPFAKAAVKSSKEVKRLIERLAMELKISMFGVGAKNIKNLEKVEIVKI